MNKGPTNRHSVVDVDHLPSLRVGEGMCMVHERCRLGRMPGPIWKDHGEL